MKELKIFQEESGHHRYSVLVPNFIAEQDYSHWEKDRLASMEANLKRGQILFDIGSELGWQSVIYSGFVGPNSVCLFESVPEIWPTLRAVWEANCSEKPMAFCRALVSNRTTVERFQWTYWPVESGGPLLDGYDNWSAIHSKSVLGGPEVSLDDFVCITGIFPDALTIDVEGAEVRVLQGARGLLRARHPLLWLSLHPNVRLAKYGRSKEQLRSWLVSLGYAEEYLGVDHEEHWLFYPKGAGIAKVKSPWGTHGKRNQNFEQAIPNWTDPWQATRATWGTEKAW